MNGRLGAAVAVLGAAALFGTTGTVRQLLVPDAPGAGVAAMRLLVGAAGLVVYVLWRRRGADLIVLWRRPVVWVMGAAVAGYQALFFLGTARTGVAVGTLISLAIAPFLAGLLGWALREGAPGWAWVASTVIAVLGVGLLVSGSLSSGDPVGMTFAAGAGACYAVYTVLGVRLARDDHAPSSVLAASFAIGAVLLLPAAVVYRRVMEVTGAGQFWIPDIGLCDGIAAEYADAVAEWAHRKMLEPLGGRKGARFGPGYPSCPDTGLSRTIAELTEAWRIGVTVTDSNMLEPEMSTSAVMAHRPRARIFNRLV